MTEHENPMKNDTDQKRPPPSTNSRAYKEIKNNPEISHYSGQKAHYPNPPEGSIPDPATLREQWKFAIRQYSRWYSQAWGTAILAGVSFFALGWIIKGSNPLPSLSQSHDPPPPSSNSPSSDTDDKVRR